MDEDELLRAFDEDLAELQQAGADLPHDDGVSARQADLHERVRTQARALVEAGRLSPGQSFVVRLTAATYNLCDYTAEAAPTRGQQHALIRELNPDVLCVQELKHHTDDPRDPALAELLGRLCEELGLHGRLAYARSGHHTAVLFRPGLKLSGWVDYRHWPWHHACGLATLDVGARQMLHVGSAHASPFSADQRAHEAQLLGALAPEPAEWMLLGADLNSPSVRAPEPYATQEPGPHQLHQRTISEIDPYNSDVAPVDRRAALLLERHGLGDLTDRGPNNPWPMTSGHHPNDSHGPRAPDCLRMSPALLARAGAPHVTDTDPARAASDHLPLSTNLTLPWRAR